MAPTDKVTSKRLRAMVGTVYISTTYNLILGMNGEDATEATSGKDAPMVHIDLSRPRNHTTSSAVCVKIQNTPKHPHETDTKYFHDLHKNGMIHVSACGGRGGNGEVVGTDRMANEAEKVAMLQAYAVGVTAEMEEMVEAVVMVRAAGMADAEEISKFL